MASNTSKTARASVRAGAGSGSSVTVLGEYKYLIPANSGKNVYVRNIVTGKTPNVKTNSDAFVAQIKSLSEGGHGAKVRAELEAFVAAHPNDGWDATLARLDEAEAFASAS